MFQAREASPAWHQPTSLLRPTVKQCCGGCGLERVRGLLWSLGLHCPLPVGPPLGTPSVKPPQCWEGKEPPAACGFPGPGLTQRRRPESKSLTPALSWAKCGRPKAGSAKGHSWAAPTRHWVFLDLQANRWYNAWFTDEETEGQRGESPRESPHRREAARSPGLRPNPKVPGPGPHPPKVSQTRARECGSSWSRGR